MRAIVIAIMIVVGALAYRSASFIYTDIRGGFAARLAIAFSESPARQLLYFYVIAGLPLAFLNGYLLRHSWIDCAIVGFGTWAVMLVSIAMTRRFNPVIQFYVFAPASLLWLAFDVARAFHCERLNRMIIEGTDRSW